MTKKRLNDKIIANINIVISINNLIIIQLV